MVKKRLFGIVLLFILLLVTLVVAWESDWESDGSIEINTFAGNPYNSEVLIANVTWDDFDNDTYKYVYNWPKITVANLPFEGDNDTETQDYSRNNNGTVNGATLNQTGGVDNYGAFEFDGIDDYISLSSTSDINGGNHSNISIELWFKANDIYAPGKQVLYEQGASLRGLNIYISGGNIHVGGWNTPPSESNWAGIYLNSPSISNGQWHHVVLVLDNGIATVQPKTLKGYLDGSEFGSGPGSQLWDHASGDIAVGRNGNTRFHDGPDNIVGEYFNGTIDELRIYNRALTPEQVGSLFKDGALFIEPSMTLVDQLWVAEATANNRSIDGVTKSTNVTILNTPAYQEDPILNSTNPLTNDTYQNLTAWPQNIVDYEADDVKAIFNWEVNEESIMVLNMPFERSNYSEGNNTKDYSGYGNDATESGSIVWDENDGYDGKGVYEFDGSNDHLVVPSPSFAGTILEEPFATVAWAKKATSSGAKTILSQQNGAGTGRVWLIMDPNDCDAGEVGTFVGGTPPLCSTTTTNVGEWYHIAVNYDGTNVSLYLNGELEATEERTADEGADGDMIIGAHKNLINRMDGFIDELQIYQRALSPEQIQAIYNNETDLIVSQETTGGDVWNVEVTPNDGNSDGEFRISNDVSIYNTPPTHDTPILNTTDPLTNATTENLTLYGNNVQDLDGNEVREIVNWKKYNSSITQINMPFEKVNATSDDNARDYSGNGFDAVIWGDVFWQENGIDGGGALYFEGDHDKISTNGNGVTLSSNTAFSVWAKSDVVIGSGIHEIYPGIASSGPDGSWDSYISFITIQLLEIQQFV